MSILITYAKPGAGMTLGCSLCGAADCPSLMVGAPVDPAVAHLYPVGFRNAGICPHTVSSAISGYARMRIREVRIQFSGDQAYADVERRLLGLGL